jgi:hypothetical protein
MSKSRPSIEYKGRSLGIVLLVAAQLLIGFIHVVFGFWLLAATLTSSSVGFVGLSSAPVIYSIYTIVFSLFTLLFAYLLWLQNRWGWFSTFAVLIFVIVADSLTLLDLPSVPGIPKFAGYGEITYSVLVIIYLLQAHVRAKYGINL